MEQILPYHEMQITAQDGQAIVRLTEIQPGDAFTSTTQELFYVWQFPGLGAFSFNEGTNFMLGNDFLYVSPGQRLLFDADFTDSKTFVLRVDKPAFHRHFAQHPPSFLKPREIHALLDYSSPANPFLIHFPDSKPTIKIMDLLLSDFQDFIQPTELVLNDVLRLLNSLANISDKVYQPLMVATKKDPVFYTMKKIREEYQTVTLDELAEELNYSKTYISNAMKRVVGKGFEEMLAFRREMVGIKLLRDDLPMQQVAEQLGFDTYAGFYKFWKRRTGISPQEYHTRMLHASDGSLELDFGYGVPMES